MTDGGNIAFYRAQARPRQPLSALGIGQPGRQSINNRRFQGSVIRNG
jgi:hypothetical protein